MIFNKRDLIKKLRLYLRSEYPEDFIFSAFNKIFDLVVYRSKDDIHYKIVLDNEYKDIEDVKKFIRNSTYSSSFIKKKVVLACYSRDTKKFIFINV